MIRKELLLANKPQQQTLSLRISEGMRQRLERARQLISSKTGEIVSTSEIAERLLESAREERMEVVDLMADPTETLLQIRRKGEAEHVLSKADWTILAHFVQQGLEAFSSDAPRPVSQESLVAVRCVPCSISAEKGELHKGRILLAQSAFRLSPRKGQGRRSHREGNAGSRSPHGDRDTTTIE